MEAPEYQSGFCTQFVTEKRHSIDNKAAGGGDHFMVEDLLDFSNDDDAIIADTPFEAATTTVAGNSTDSSIVTVVDSCNSSSFSGCDPNFVSDICRNFPDANFSSDLCVPVIHQLI
nr:hypothetical protein CFP56_32626 [Quercus suber]